MLEGQVQTINLEKINCLRPNVVGRKMEQEVNGDFFLRFYVESNNNNKTIPIKVNHIPTNQLRARFGKTMR